MGYYFVVAFAYVCLIVGTFLAYVRSRQPLVYLNIEEIEVENFPPSLNDVIIAAFLSSRNQRFTHAEVKLYRLHHAEITLDHYPQFTCPITHHLFIRPVKVAYKYNDVQYVHYFECSAIKRWWGAELNDRTRWSHSNANLANDLTDPINRICLGEVTELHITYEQDLRREIMQLLRSKAAERRAALFYPASVATATRSLALPEVSAES
jgi:hypothetical protein